MELNGCSNSTFRLGLPRTCLVVLAGAFLGLAGAADSRADSYPSRPVRIIVPTQAGAAQDIIARLLQPYLEKAFGQPIIVENRSGASTMIGTDAVAKAAPDGHTLLIVPTTFNRERGAECQDGLRPRARFAPITVLVKNPLLFAINAKVPARTLGELVTLVKADPENSTTARRARRPRRISARDVERTRRHQDAACTLPRRSAGGAPPSRPARFSSFSYRRSDIAADRGGPGAPARHRRLTRDPKLPELPTRGIRFPGNDGGGSRSASRPSHCTAASKPESRIPPPSQLWKLRIACQAAGGERAHQARLDLRQYPSAIGERAEPRRVANGERRRAPPR